METLDVVMPETMPLERLEAEITELAGHLAAAECRWMLLIAEFDRRAGYEQWGCRTCSHWLSWQCGLDMRGARDRVRVARALEPLPLITHAFAAGTVSYSKVRALVRVATPANEASLVMIAQHATATQVERTVRAYRGVLSQDDELDETNARHAARFLRCDWADDGSLEGRFRMTPEVGAVFLQAISLMREHIPPEPVDENGSAEPPRDHAATNIDALAMIVESFFEHGAGGNGGDRYQIVINTDAEVLSDDADGICELDNGPALAPETVRRLACDVREKRPLPPVDARNVEHDNEIYGITIDRNTCIPRCYGDKLDLDHIVTGLLCIDHPELILGAMN